MSHRTYFYCRVSTTEQTTANQVQAFKDKGYDVNEQFVVEDNVSVLVPALARKEFNCMVEHKLASGDTLVVLKLDRLGRDNIDVQKTIDMLIEKGINVHCLDLPVKDLSTAEGKLMLQTSRAFAEFEHNRIREWTAEGQARVRAKGRTIGRPKRVTPEKVWELWKQKHSIVSVAKALDISISSVERLKAQAENQIARKLWEMRRLPLSRAEQAHKLGIPVSVYQRFLTLAKRLCAYEIIELKREQQLTDKEVAEKLRMNPESVQRLQALMTLPEQAPAG
ncbi:hypothetical protein DI392_06110 [Vibrio albus]|uniref:Resolvase/invertase-type recombinase catalytic domain-containing protein n=1 Tax=Vibrio albus TaxID=2200953 RepID=A0A2U3BCZ1_9VIBR|nr:hypothetical protein DI392_06110 [Vibrio albus]